MSETLSLGLSTLRRDLDNALIQAMYCREVATVLHDEVSASCLCEFELRLAGVSNDLASFVRELKADAQRGKLVFNCSHCELSTFISNGVDGTGTHTGKRFCKPCAIKGYHHG